MDSINSVAAAAQQQTWNIQQPAAPNSAPETAPSEEKDGLQSMLTQQEEETKNLIEMMREAQEKVEEQRKKLEQFYKDTRNTRYGDAPIEACSRLARAKTRSQVDAASGYARRRIAQLKQALRQDSDNASAIRGAINQLEKAVRRADKKKKDLAQEAFLDARRAKSKEAGKRQEEQRLRLEIQRRKTQRMIRESGYLREAEIDKRLHAQLVQTQMELREQMQALAPLQTASLETAAQQYAAAAAAPAPEPQISGGA